MESATPPLSALTSIGGERRRTALVVAGALLAWTIAFAATGHDRDVLLLLPLGLLGLLLLRFPEAGLLVAAAAIPADFDVHLGATRGLLISKLLGAALAATLAYDVLVRGRRVRFVDDPLDHAVVGFVVLALLSAITGGEGDPNELLRVVWKAGYYFCVKNLIRSGATLRRVASTLVLSGGAVAGYSIWAFFRASVLRSDVRIGGISMDPNDFAALLLVVVMLAFHLGVHAGPVPRRLRRMSLLACVVGSYAIVLTGSRAGFLSLVVVGLIAVWRQSDRRRAMLTVAAVAVVSWLGWPQSVTERMFATFGRGVDSKIERVARASTNRRATYISVALDAIAERPWTGHGYHSFRTLYSRSEYVRLANPLRSSDRFRVAHNTYLELAVGAGLPALMTFAAILWLSRRRLRLFRLDRSDVPAAVASGFEMGLIGLLLMMLFLSVPVFTITWFIFGVAAAVGGLGRVAPGRAPKPGVCILVPLYPPNAGGAEVSAERVAGALAELGTTVTVITTRQAQAEPLIDDRRNLRVVRIPVPAGKVGRAIVYLALGCIALWRQRGRFDLLHSHQVFSATTLGLLGHWLLEYPLVVNPHSSGPLGDVRKLQAKGIVGRLRLQTIRRNAGAFVAISEEIAAELREIGVPDARMTCLAHPVDLQRFRPVEAERRTALRVELGLPPHLDIVVYAGRLDPMKGLRILIEAMSGTPGFLSIVGDGPERAVLEETAARHLPGRVFFAGYRNDIERWLMAADVAVLPSFAEGKPVSLIEAAACGLPVVATRVGGVPEIVTDGDNGWLVSPGDAGGLGVALREALGDAAERRRRGARGRARAEAEFGTEVVARSYAALYDRVRRSCA